MAFRGTVVATRQSHVGSYPGEGLRGDIQGLRAIAVLAVMIFHVNKEWLPGGFVGVDIFLVISGFLIASIILEQKKNLKFDFLRFYWGRLRRILPACYVMLAIVSVVSAFLFVPLDFGFYADSLKSSLYFASNQYFSGFGDYFSPSVYELPLLHTWSLAVEMQFYLVLPFLLYFVPFRWLKIIVPLFIVLLTACVEYALRVKGQQQEMYFSLLARVPEFLIGAAVAVFRFGESWSSRLSNCMAWIGFFLLAFSLFLIDESRGFPGLVALIPCVGTALLIAARDCNFSRFLSLAILVWIGGLSYSLYLWHWPILSIMRYYVGHYSLELPWLVVFFLVTFVAAWLSFRWVEGPFRRERSVSTSGRKIFVFSLGVIPLFLFSGYLNSNVVDPLPIEMTRYADPSEICHGKIVGNCVRGALSEKSSALLLGDSHGAQLNHFYDAVGAVNKFSVRIITSSSCIPIPGFDIERLPKWSQSACAAQIEVGKKFIESSDSFIIAGMWQYQTQSEAFMRAFEAFLSSADAKGKKVLVMAQIPMFESNLLRVHRFNSLGLPFVNIERNSEWQDANFKIKSVVEKYPSAKYLDFSSSSFFLNAPFEGDVLLYQDNHHLNEVGAHRYGEFAAPFFRELKL